jgi:cytidylate kinase
MPTTIRGGHDVARTVERQMRNWELARAQHLPLIGAPKRPPVAHFVTISRMVGVGGTEVGIAVGVRLGWPVFDKELLTAMAGDDQVRARLYERLDERDTSWMEEALRWLLQGGHGKHAFFRRLSETMLALTRQGPAVFLGRGAEMILPREYGLRVRLIAPREWCVQQLVQTLSRTRETAEAEFDRVQHERDEYMRTHFHTHPGGPPRHDLIINRAAFSVDATVELIVTALRLRQARG